MRNKRRFSPIWLLCDQRKTTLILESWDIFGMKLFPYFGYVLWRLAHGIEYIYGRWQVNVFEISNCVSIYSWILHLGHIFHHLRLKLGVHGAGLNHGQAVGSQMQKGPWGSMYNTKWRQMWRRNRGKKVIYRILNFISCTAMLSQKPSMANLEAV